MRARLLTLFESFTRAETALKMRYAVLAHPALPNLADMPTAIHPNALPCDEVTLDQTDYGLGDLDLPSPPPEGRGVEHLLVVLF